APFPTPARSTARNGSRRCCVRSDARPGPAPSRGRRRGARDRAGRARARSRGRGCPRRSRRRRSARSRGRELDPVAGREDAHVGGRRDPRDLLREVERRTLERTRAEAREPERIERAPVDRDRQARSYARHDLRGAQRIEMAGTDRRSPAPHGQERDVHRSGEVAHAREEVGVAGEVHARRAGDAEPDGDRRRPERPAPGMVERLGRLDREAADAQALARRDLGDVVAVARDERRSSDQAAQGRKVQVIVVGMGNDDCIRRDPLEPVVGGVRPATDRAETAHEQGIGQDARAVDVDERSRMAEEVERGAGGTHRPSVCVYRADVVDPLGITGFYRRQLHLLWRWSGGWHTVAWHGALIFATSVAAFGVTAWLVPGIAVRDAPVAVVAALALALVAIVTRPVLIALLSGVSVMLVGAGTLVLQALALLAVARLSAGIGIDGTRSAIGGAAIYAVTHTLLAAGLSIANDDSFFGTLVRQLAARSPRERVAGPGVVFVQIDGLAHPALERAIHDGLTPTLARWLATGNV